MSQVKSTFNFVPAPNEQEVFKPHWADQVSHDVPFEDGESGEIEIEITAETPIFIREGISQAEAKKKIDSHAPFEFSHYFDGKGNKHFIIPATSLKGIIRSNLEILSLSRIKQLDDSKIFGLRDMANSQYDKSEIRKIQSGWLLFENGRWVIRPCENNRVSIQSIISELKPSRILEKNGEREEAIEFKKASAKQKYLSLNLNSFKHELKFSFEKHVDKTGDIYSVNKNNGSFSGALVLYGSMDNKKYDYIFSEPSDEEIFNLDTYIVEKTKKVKCVLLERILDIEKDNDDSLWHYFINELKLTKIPVFFKEENGKVKHFGFSKLYRLNNGHYLKELEPLKGYENKKDLDLATTIFGNAEDGNALKGRVFFSNAKHIKNEGESAEEERILSTPNASYYPFYLNQEGNGGILKNGQNYNTYVNEKSSLKGFKRYPVHTTVKKGDLQKDSMSSKFKPLNAGNSFRFKIRYHNLKKAEIGALYSALTFHNTPDCYHSLGGGKPYGFGKVKFSIVSDSSRLIDYLYAFESEVERYFKDVVKKTIVYDQTPQVKELIATAKNSAIDSFLKYPQLELPNVAPKDQNEFNNIKKEKKYIKPHSENFKDLKIQSSKIDFNIFKENENRLKIQKSNDLKLHAYELLKEGKFEEALKRYQEALEVYDDNSFDLFRKKVEDEKYAKSETIAFEEILNSDDISKLELFISQFPLSQFKGQIQSKISKLKANSGLSTRLQSMTESDKFFKECTQWVNKLEGKTLLGSGHEKVVEEKILSLCLMDKNVNNKLLQNWMNERYKKTVSSWYSESYTNELWQKIEKIINQ